MRSSWVAVAFTSMVALGVAAAARADDAPDVDEVLKKVDAALFFYDRQEKLPGYNVEVLTVQATATPGKRAEPRPGKDAKPSKIAWDAATGAKKQTDAGGAALEPTSFVPACGPWTLTPLVAFEIELFARPFGERFSAAAFDRECEATEAGWRLKLTPKQPIGGAGFMLKPTLTGLELEIDKDGVPARGTMHLDQKVIKEDGAIEFQFEDVKGKKRIAKIANTITSANLRITPVLTFTFGEKSGPALPQLVEFRVAGGQLSGTMSDMDMITFLVYRNWKVKKAK